ncbi:MAG TPA: phosphotransferase [Candidatus Limnocylindrales bacterium]|nr:phosphotransferase [Candidatus Limnocylindrales bacterium]
MDRPRPSTPPDAREAASAFGLGAVSGPVVPSARGELGRIWRLVTDRGTWALKELFEPGPGAAEAATADVAFQERALAGGIPMPRPIVARDGAALVEVGPAADRRWVRIYTWVELRGRDAVAPLDEVASILGRLHALAPPDDRPIDPWFREPPERARLEALVERAAQADVPWASTLEGLVPIVLETTDAVGRPAPEPDDRRTCHLDYNAENVLVDASGSVCVVDWENSGPALVEGELASAVAQFAAQAELVAPFLRAYAAAGGPARLRDRASFALTAIVDANLVETYARRALQAGDPEDRERAAYWIGDIAANAFTLERIDAWLEAARDAGFG